MEVFEEKVKVSKQDSEYIISVAISDNVIVSRTITKNELQQLLSDLNVLVG